MELTSGRRKLHLHLPIPPLLSFKQLVPVAVREFLSISDKYLQPKFIVTKDEVRAEIKVTKIAGIEQSVSLVGPPLLLLYYIGLIPITFLELNFAVKSISSYN